MKLIENAQKEFVLEIIRKVPDMSLATIRPDGFPQATTVSYAHDGLTLYVGVGIDSQKAHNVRQNNKVSLTITSPYNDWNHIQGVSMAGIAVIVNDADELQHACDCMLRRFPQIKTMSPDASALPWEGAIFLRIAPTVISILDYEKGFGHTELVAVQPDSAPAPV